MKDNLKVTIGCRVELDFRERLIEMQKEGKYSSFSQFLEDLIIKAVDENKALKEEPNEVPKSNNEVLNLLNEIINNLNDSESNIIEAIENTADKTSSLDTDTIEILQEEFIVRLAKLLGFDYESEEQVSNIREVFFDTDTTEESFIEFSLLKERQNELLDEALEQKIDALNLLPVQFSKESKDLILDYFNYLVKNNHAVSLEGALVGSLYHVLKLNKGGFLNNGFYGWEKYLKQFENANEKILSNQSKITG